MYERKNASGPFVPALTSPGLNRRRLFPPQSPTIPHHRSRGLRDIISCGGKRKRTKRNGCDGTAREDQSRRAEIIREIGRGLRKSRSQILPFARSDLHANLSAPESAHSCHTRFVLARYYIELSLAKFLRVRSRNFFGREDRGECLNLLVRARSESICFVFWVFLLRHGLYPYNFDSLRS